MSPYRLMHVYVRMEINEILNEIQMLRTTHFTKSKISYSRLANQSDGLEYEIFDFVK